MPRVSVSFLAAPKGPVPWGHFFFPPFPHFLTVSVSLCWPLSLLSLSAGAMQVDANSQNSVGLKKPNNPHRHGGTSDRYCFSKVLLIIWTRHAKE